jgi:hypothetical protein
VICVVNVRGHSCEPKRSLALRRDARRDRLFVLPLPVNVAI